MNDLPGAQPDGDPATCALPHGEGLGAWRLGLILMGALIALPCFVTGAELAHALGRQQALLACLGGGAVLLLLALPAAYAGARSRLSTYMLILDAFGSVGGRCVNLVLSLALLGWFGVVAGLFGQAMAAAAPAFLAGVPAQGWSLVGCLLMLLTNLVGFRALDRLSQLATPLKLGLVLWACWVALKGHGMPPAGGGAGDYSVLQGMSLVVGGVVIGCILLPDICRHALSPGRALAAVFCAFGLGFPLVLALAGLPSLATGERQLVAIMLALGLGLPAMLIILLSAWSTNAYNLYAATLVCASVAPQVQRRRLALFTGLVGATLGLAGLGDALQHYLALLAVALPPVGGVYLCNYYLNLRGAVRSPRRWRPEAFGAWACGVGAAALQVLWPFTLTWVPALDSLLLAAGCYLLLRAIAARRGVRKPGVARQGSRALLP
ncbi:hypothetical protein [Pseudomonas citronellolis]|uniref:hypothetical protein n=1 Tax=Pseudomonas citronellolis TaxID=53408 RepID=UPI003C2CF549